MSDTYLFNAAKRKSSFHLWDGRDTACRMYSTGGIRPSKPDWVTAQQPPADKPLCQMCKVNSMKGLPSGAG